MKLKRDTLKKLVKETIKALALKEGNQINLDRLGQGIAPNSITGKYWLELIRGIEGLLNEAPAFNGQYLTQKANINDRSITEKLNQVVKILEEIHPEIQKMSKHERDDQL
jgi:hypothetical protein